MACKFAEYQNLQTGSFVHV